MEARLLFNDDFSVSYVEFTGFDEKYSVVRGADFKLGGLTKMLAAFAKIKCDQIIDWPSFHDEFNRVFQFPTFYGRNMNAWIDCMSSLDAPDEEMTSIHCEPGKVLTLELENVKAFMARCPDQYAAIVDCSAFVNWRRIERGQPSVLALSYYA